MPPAPAVVGGASQVGGVGDVTHSGSGDVLVQHAAPAPAPAVVHAAVPMVHAAVPVVHAAAPATTLVHQAAPVVLAAPAPAPAPDNNAVVNVAVDAIASQVSHLADMVTSMSQKLEAPLASLVPAKPMVVPNYYTFSGNKLGSMVTAKAPAEVVVGASGEVGADSTGSVGSFQ